MMALTAPPYLPFLLLHFQLCFFCFMWASHFFCCISSFVFSAVHERNASYYTIFQAVQSCLWYSYMLLSYSEPSSCNQPTICCATVVPLAQSYEPRSSITPPPVISQAIAGNKLSALQPRIESKKVVLSIVASLSQSPIQAVPHEQVEGHQWAVITL